MLRPVDLGNPVNRGASLNLGLLHWWKGMPNNKGGRTIFDLCGANHLTQVDPSSVGSIQMWSPRSKECELYFTGGPSPAYYASNDSAPEVDFSTTGVAIGAWLWPINVDTYNVVLGGSTGGTISGGFSFYVGYYLTGLLINGSAGAVYQGSGPNLVQYKPSYATWVQDVNGLRMYVDGFEVQNSSVGGARPPACRLYLGNDYWGYGINGGVGSVRVWNRSLTATEIASLYKEEVAGNPYTLNRYTPRTTVFLGTTPSTGRLFRSGGLDGLGGAGRMAINPTL